MIRRTSLSLDPETYDQIAAVQAQVREALGTRLSMSRVVCAAVSQYSERLKAAGALHGEG